GRWRTVWPCAPMALTAEAGWPACSSRACAVRAYSRARPCAATAARCSSSAPLAFSASSSARRSGGMGSPTLASTCGAAPGARRASTPSAPSRLVPDIRPTKRRPDVGERRPPDRVMGVPAEPDLAAGHVGGGFGQGLLEFRQQGDLLLVGQHGFLELAGLGGVQRAADRQVGRQGVDRLVVDAEFVVQVRPGGPAGGAHVADELALRDLGAALDARGDAALVGVDGGVLAEVLDDDHIAVAALLAGELDRAV